MNEAIDVSTDKKKLNQIFNIIDRNKCNLLRLEDIKNYVQLKFNMEEDEKIETGDDWNIKEPNLKGNDILIR